MPCGPVSGRSARTNDAFMDPFGFGQTAALMQGWANMAIIFSAPIRAALVVADEAMRPSDLSRD